MRRLELKLHGLVQGVNFRHHTAQEARRLGLTGFVQNEPDGTVLIVAEGPAGQLSELLDWSKQGPDSADVAKWDESWLNAKGDLTEFVIRRS